MPTAGARRGGTTLPGTDLDTGSLPRLLWSPDESDPGWFHTQEWEAAADWDVPAEWPSGHGPGRQSERLETRELEWLLGPSPAAAASQAPAAALRPPLPRRRDLRKAERSGAALPPVESATAQSPPAPVSAPTPAPSALPGWSAAPPDVLDLTDPGLDSADALAQPVEVEPLPPFPVPARPPATPSTGLPRRRDVRNAEQAAIRRREQRTAVQSREVLPERTVVPTRAATRSGLRTHLARAGVLSALVAVGTVAVSGGVNVDALFEGGATEISAEDAAAALRLAPLPVETPQVTIWGSNGDLAGLHGAREQAAKVRDYLEAQAAAEAARRERLRKLAEERARKLAEERARKLAEERAAAKERAMRDAQRNPKAIGKIMAAERGWTGEQWTCLELLWERESGWNYAADNPSSSAYGIPQALPGSKMASHGSDWRTNPVTQIAWGLDYIADRYGTPCGAWAHSEDVGWY